MKADIKTSYHERILRVLVYIQANLDRPLSLVELASVAVFSPYHFYRVFRGMVGEGVGEHLRRLRLERAAGGRGRAGDGPGFGVAGPGVSRAGRGLPLGGPGAAHSWSSHWRASSRLRKTIMEMPWFLSPKAVIISNIRARP